MLAGMGLVIFEVQFHFLRHQMGASGHAAALLCGTALSVWGLKEVVAHFWPRMTSRGSQFRVPVEGIIYLVIMFVLFVAAVLSRSNLLLLVYCVMAGSFIVNGWLTYSMLRGARMGRELPRRVMAGETLMVTLTLENRNSRLSAWLMTLHDTIQHDSTILRPEVLFVRVPPQSLRVGTYRLRPLARGRYHFTYLDAITRFPLGMVQRGLGGEARDELLVYPRLGHLRPRAQRVLLHSAELASHSRHRNGTFQDEIHRIREFRPGDDLRMIHWRTTARMNELMVCEYHECRDRDLVILVDAWWPVRPLPQEKQQFEHGLQFAATLCMNYLRTSRQSSLTVYLRGRESLDWYGDSGTQHTDTLLDAFAMLEPDSSPELERLTDNLDTAQIESCRILLISSRPVAAREQLLRAFPTSVLDLQVFSTSPKELQCVFDESEIPNAEEEGRG